MIICYCGSLWNVSLLEGIFDLDLSCIGVLILVAREIASYQGYFWKMREGVVHRGGARRRVREGTTWGWVLLVTKKVRARVRWRMKKGYFARICRQLLKGTSERWGFIGQTNSTLFYRLRAKCIIIFESFQFFDNFWAKIRSSLYGSRIINS